MSDRTDEAIAARERTRERLEGAAAGTGFTPPPPRDSDLLLTAIQQINGRLDNIERMLILQLKFSARSLDMTDPLRDQILKMLAVHQDYDEMRHGG